MLGFVRSGSYDRFVRINDIERLGVRPAVEGERQRYFMRLQGGDAFDLNEIERDELLRRPVQIIPAEPGVSILRMGVDKGELWEVREALIAWALCLDGEVRPVAPNGIPNDTQEAVYVEMPSGKIEGVGEWADPCCFSDVEAMRAYHRASKERALDGL